MSFYPPGNGPERFEFSVDAGDDGTRLDRFVADRIVAASRSAVQKWIRAGAVRVDGQERKARYAVCSGEMISVVVPEPEPTELVPENIALDILYEDDRIVVVDKPAGMVVHPGAGNRRGTLANALAFYLESEQGPGANPPLLVHRLDKDTSGVLLVARDATTHQVLAEQFKRRETKKEYVALVYGRLESDSGDIDLPLGRDRHSRTRFSPRSRKLRNAQTRYKVERRFDSFTLMLAWPRTGRTHQIRVHFSEIGHPVVGDVLYGRGHLKNVKDPEVAGRIRELKRHFLHASKLTFKHPSTGREVTLESRLADELAEFLSTLGK